MSGNNTREWTPQGGGPTWLCPPKACMFCDHCSDIYWDYTNGPYLCFCNLDIDPNTGGYEGKCDSFIEEE